MQKIRRAHPRAYQRWTEDELRKLRSDFEAGASLDMLVETLQRHPGAIISRLRQLGFDPPVDPLELIGSPCSFGLGPPELPGEPVVDREVSLGFKWRPVLAGEGSPYAFPGPVTAFMAKRYAEPAVYRWMACLPNSEQPEWLYVGTSKCLCPDRLEGYLAPERSKTNHRVSLGLHRALRNGFQVRLEILSEECITLGGKALAAADLQADAIRLAVERLVIACYRQQGIKLLNL